MLSGVTYHFRAVASNSSAVVFGSDQSFGTIIPPFAQHAYLKASNTGTNDHFGRSLALSEQTLVVGAPFEDSNATGVNGTGTDPNRNFNSGAAYVFVRNGTNWIQQAYLKASNTGPNDSRLLYRATP